MTAGGAAPAPVVRRALSLSLLNTAISKFGGFFVSVALARILLPEDFGTFAVALVALTAVLSFNELGVSLAIVRWDGDPDEIVPTVTTISILSSVVLYTGCWFGAPLFADAMGAPDATGVLRLLCVAVLVDGFTAAGAQLVNRDFRQGARLAIDLLNLVATSGVTIGLAVSGHGAWSLAWGQLVGSVISALLLFRLVSRWPRPGFDPAVARRLIAFGLPLAGASFVVFAMLNVDYLVIGWKLDAVALGFYLLAFNLSSWPVSTFSVVIRRVSLAAFSRVQHEPKRRVEELAKLTVLLAVPSLPVCALLGMLALPVVTTLYGEKWAAAAAALQFLVVLGIVRVFAELAYDFLIALGRSRWCLWLQVLWLAGLVVLLPIGADLDGIAGVAMMQAVVAVGVALPAFVLAVRATGVPLAALGSALCRPVIATVLLVLVVAGVRFLTEPSLLQAAIGSAAGLAVYTAVVWPMRHVLSRSAG